MRISSFSGSCWNCWISSIANWTALNRFEDLALVNSNAKISGCFGSTYNVMKFTTTRPLLVPACFQLYLPSIIFFIILFQSYAFDMLCV